MVFAFDYNSTLVNHTTTSGEPVVRHATIRGQYSNRSERWAGNGLSTMCDTAFQKTTGTLLQENTVRKPTDPTLATTPHTGNYRCQTRVFKVCFTERTFTRTTQGKPFLVEQTEVSFRLLQKCRKGVFLSLEFSERRQVALLQDSRTVTSQKPKNNPLIQKC